MKYFFTVCLFLLSGCVSVTLNSTKSWEGHFKNVEEFKAATENITLDKNETIWVLSNRTLKRVLKNTGK
jgi:hypothetical protein